MKKQNGSAREIFDRAFSKHRRRYLKGDKTAQELHLQWRENRYQLAHHLKKIRELLSRVNKLEKREMQVESRTTKEAGRNSFPSTYGR